MLRLEYKSFRFESITTIKPKSLLPWAKTSQSKVTILDNNKMRFKWLVVLLAFIAEITINRFSMFCELFDYSTLRNVNWCQLNLGDLFVSQLEYIFLDLANAFINTELHATWLKNNLSNVSEWVSGVAFYTPPTHSAFHSSLTENLNKFQKHTQRRLQHEIKVWIAWKLIFCQ